MRLTSVVVFCSLWGSTVHATQDIQFADGFEGVGIVLSCGEPVKSVGRCDVEAGTGGLLIRSHVASPSNLLRNAELLVDESGTIQCMSCDCSNTAGYDAATVLNCPDVLTTPGLINSHDHLTFQSGPATHGTERYDHRHDWRRGIRGHSSLSAASTNSVEGRTWGELRQTLAGVTSMIGSGSAPGFVRNLDRISDREGLPGPNVDANSFPLGDSSGQLIDSGCGYPNLPSPDSGEVYQAHLVEGVDAAARNEWVCASESLENAGGQGLPGPSLLHAIALNAPDVAELVEADASVVWSPRSDIDLYGMTAPVSLLETLGVNIALGTNWTTTGSSSMLREFACAGEFNETALNGRFSSRRLLEMATTAAATAAGIDDQIGQLAPGYIADLAMFDARVNADYSAVLNAAPADVVLVLRAGTPLYGDGETVAALGFGDGSCELMGAANPGDCLAGQRLCVARESGLSYSQLRAETVDLYPAYFCDNTPPNEPSCTPTRDEGDGIVYTGIPSENDQDGDGVVDATDNCIHVFNPPRPVDGFQQSDEDGDGAGDACDAEPNSQSMRSTP